MRSESCTAAMLVALQVCRTELTLIYAVADVSEPLFWRHVIGIISRLMMRRTFRSSRCVILGLSAGR
jgi:hypothetical protein